ncbi:GAF domain-containing protein [Micrococcales bacterium 31B]|nr:GAF domain-containing protein [Micrococcales bacterium 31B]
MITPGLINPSGQAETLTFQVTRSIAEASNFTEVRGAVTAGAAALLPHGSYELRWVPPQGDISDLFVLHHRGHPIGSLRVRAPESAQRIEWLAALAETAFMRLATRAKPQVVKDAQTRARAAEAARAVTTSLLSGADNEDVLQSICDLVESFTGADAVVMVLPALNEQWLIEFIAGPFDHLIGIVMPAGGRTRTSLRTRQGILEPSLAHTEELLVDELRSFGPALYAPLVNGAHAVGVLIALREIGAAPFTEDDLALAETFATQAALALELAEARHASETTELLSERQRISRDLHDLAIQQLFAAGVQLEEARRMAGDLGAKGAPLASTLQQTINTVTSSVTQIRSIVHALRNESEVDTLEARVRREIAMASVGFGFRPSLHMSIAHSAVLEQVRENSSADSRHAGPLNARVHNDVVAVVREALSNALRHSKASAVAVTLTTAVRPPFAERDSVWFTINVADNGVGIDVTPRRSSGMANLAARAREHGGVFSVEATDPGTLLTWQVPLDLG